MGRRFDRHQTESTAAINAVHGEISKISEMMNQMASNFARLSPEPVSEPPASTKVHRFSTPPPLPVHSLSPITEQPTPTATSYTHPSPPFPPHFGNLSPEQLPHPPSPYHNHTPNPNVRSYATTQPITITTPPIVTTIQHPQNSLHYTQVTTPHTQPHYYQSQNPQTFTFPPQSHPPCSAYYTLPSPYHAHHQSPCQHSPYHYQQHYPPPPPPPPHTTPPPQDQTHKTIITIILLNHTCALHTSNSQYLREKHRELGYWSARTSST